MNVVLPALRIYAILFDAVDEGNALELPGPF